MARTTKEETKAEYLHSLQQDVEDMQRLREQGVQRIFRNGAKLLLVTAVVIGIGAAGTVLQERNAVAAFQSTGILSYEFLYAGHVFDDWNAAGTGNDVNALLTGGKVLIRDGVYVTGVPADDTAGKFQIIPNASYLNKMGSQIIYSDDQDRHIYAYDLDTKQKSIIYTGNSGEVFCTKDSIYFVDYDEGAALMKIDPQKPTDKTAVVKSPVKSFAVCGDTVIFLDEGSVLKKQAVGGKSTDVLMKHVERFFLNGHILAETKNTIVEFKPDGRDSKKLLQDADPEASLVGISGQKLFLQSNGELASWTKGAKTSLRSAANGLYGSIVEDKDNQAYYGIEYQQDNSSHISLKLVKLEEGE